MNDDLVFRDRADAGAKLAKQLERHRGPRTLVLGIPRGGVVVAAEVARRLAAELDLIVARKLGAPTSEELAIGAVTANGGRYLNDSIIRALNVSPEYLERVTEREEAEARRREGRFRGGRPAPQIAGRTVIVVDDGLATGATMHAAVRAIRQQSPARLIVAVPVGSGDACAAIRQEVDELVCLFEPALFDAVGAFYLDFQPTDDAVVERLLREFQAAAA
jgi:putative phosphoribosyl transferase